MDKSAHKPSHLLADESLRYDSRFKVVFIFYLFLFLFFLCATIHLLHVATSGDKFPYGGKVSHMLKSRGAERSLRKCAKKHLEALGSPRRAKAVRVWERREARRRLG